VGRLLPCKRHAIFILNGAERIYLLNKVPNLFILAPIDRSDFNLAKVWVFGKYYFVAYNVINGLF